MKAQFKDKISETCNNITIEESKCYDTVKKAISKTVQVDHEVHGRRFRGVRKLQTVTYLDLARDCVIQADRWLNAANVKSKEEFSVDGYGAL